MTFGDVVKKSFKKMKVITLSTGFCTLLTSAIVKVLLNLIQQVVLKNGTKSRNASLYDNI